MAQLKRGVGCGLVGGWPLGESLTTEHQAGKGNAARGESSLSLALEHRSRIPLHVTSLHPVLFLLPDRHAVSPFCPCNLARTWLLQIAARAVTCVRRSYHDRRLVVERRVGAMPAPPSPAALALGCD